MAEFACGSQRSVFNRIKLSSWRYIILFLSLWLGYHAGVSAQGDVTAMVRLIDGMDSHTGVLEYNHPQENAWVPVCGAGIQVEDAHVVCYELGFYGGAASLRNVTYPPFNPGQNDSALINVFCEHDDVLPTRLKDCTMSGVNYDILCNGQAAEITCRTTRLYNPDGGWAESGRIEVWEARDNSWGKICSPEFGEEEQTVVCGELGFMYRSGSLSSPNQFENPMSPYAWGEVRCHGDETSLVDCDVEAPESTCEEDDDAFTICTNTQSDSDEPQFLEVKLEDGPCEMEGRLMVYDGSRWGTVCQERITQLDAQVICRQLGFESPEDAAVVTCCNEYPSARAGVEKLFGELNCTGSEYMIAECSHPVPGSLDGCESRGHHDNDVGIRCQSCGPRGANVAAIAGAVVAVLLVVIIIVAVVAWYKCYYRQRKYQEKVGDHEAPGDEETEMEEKTKPMLEENDLNAGDLEEKKMNMEEAEEERYVGHPAEA